MPCKNHVDNLFTTVMSNIDIHGLQCLVCLHTIIIKLFFYSANSRMADGCAVQDIKSMY